MVEASRNVRANQKFTEVRNAKHGSKCAGGLFENLLPMCNEQEACLPLLVLEEPLEIKCCHNRLSRPGRRHNQIAPVPVDEALRFQRIENSFLKGMRANVEEYRRNSLARPRMFDSFSEYKRLRRVKRNELVAVPVGLELREELVQDVRHILCCHFEIPFQPARHRRM